MPPLMLGVNGPLQIHRYLRTQVEHLTSLTADQGEIRSRSCFDFWQNESMKGFKDKIRNSANRIFPKLKLTDTDTLSSTFGDVCPEFEAQVAQKAQWESIKLVPLIPLFWTSCEVCPGFQSQGGSPRLRALSPACNGFLRLASGEEPADLLAENHLGGLHGFYLISHKIIYFTLRVKDSQNF